MAKSSPSMAKNKIQRSLLQIVYGYPNAKQIEQIWQYFDNCCAYCHTAIDRSRRNGHLDHLRAISDGGTNDQHNFVLSCHLCNGDEREQDWQVFLQIKCRELSNDEYRRRLQKILDWQKHAKASNIDETSRQEIDEIIAKAKQDFDGAVAKIRALKDKITVNNETKE